ncbi:MAG: hypothetical protein ACPGUV_05040 [Polyangiales bacterium]
MALPPLNPNHVYRFDAQRGLLHTQDGERVVMLPESLLTTLMEAVVEYGDLTALRHFGVYLGDQLKLQCGQKLDTASPEEVLTHISALLGSLGWGRVHFERWGPSLALCTEHLPMVDPDRLSAAALLGGLMSALIDQEVACVPLAESGFLIVDPKVAEAVWNQAKEGMGQGDIVHTLLEEPC